MSIELQSEIARLKGQRRILADLLEKSVVALSDVKPMLDDGNFYNHVSDLICWSRDALGSVNAEVIIEMTKPLVSELRSQGHVNAEVIKLEPK